MTVEGYKHFIDAQSMSAFDVNAFLMSQTVTRFDTAADRDAALEQVVTEGMVSYNKDTGELQLYDGSAWQTVTVAIGAAGSDGQVQYNNGGSFGGASALYFDDVNSRVGINDSTPSYTLDVAGNGRYTTDLSVNGTLVTDYIRNDNGNFLALEGGDSWNLGANASGEHVWIAAEGGIVLVSSDANSTNWANRNQVRIDPSGGIDQNLIVYAKELRVNNVGGANAKIGRWQVNDNYAMFGTDDMTGAEYCVISGGGGDGNTYISAKTGKNVVIRPSANNTSNQATFSTTGTTLGTTTFTGTITGDGSGITSLNASNISSGTFPDRFSPSTRYNIGYIDGVTGSNYDKLRVYNSSSYSIGMVSGITYGHLNDWAMTFRMNNDADRGFWWGDTSDSAAQGAMSLTTFGRLTVAQSLSVGQGNSITSPSTSTVYIGGSIDMTGDIDAASGLAYFNSVYLPSNSGIFWSNGDALKYNDSTNQFTFSGDGDTDIVNDGHLIFDSGIVLSNSDANYGSAELDGYTRGGYYGLNLNNGANFMSNGTAMGIYNDTDNDWIIYGNRNSDSFMFHNGSIRVTCRSDGVTNAGRIITDGIAYNHSNCGGSANSMALRWVNPYIKGSVDNVVCATLGTVSDERFKRDIESWDGGIDILRQLRTVTYTPRDITAWGEVSLEPIEGYEPREPKHGLIAQEVIQVMPTAVDGASTDSGYLSLNEDELIAMLISAVQNIDSRLTALGA